MRVPSTEKSIVLNSLCKSFAIGHHFINNFEFFNLFIKIFFYIVLLFVYVILHWVSL